MFSVFLGISLNRVFSLGRVDVSYVSLGHTTFVGASLVAQSVKESVCSTGDLGSVPGLGRSPAEGNGNPLQYPCLEKSHGQRSLVGYGREESDMTERLVLTEI